MSWLIAFSVVDNLTWTAYCVVRQDFNCNTQCTAWIFLPFHSLMARASGIAFSSWSHLRGHDSYCIGTQLGFDCIAAQRPVCAQRLSVKSFMWVLYSVSLAPTRNKSESSEIADKKTPPWYTYKTMSVSRRNINKGRWGPWNIAELGTCLDWTAFRCRSRLSAFKNKILTLARRHTIRSHSYQLPPWECVLWLTSHDSFN